MPRLPFRSATPALLTAGLIVGMVATTGAAVPAFAQQTDTSASSTVGAISAPLSTITADAQRSTRRAR